MSVLEFDKDGWFGIKHRIHYAAEDGDVALVRATPERHQELVRFPAIRGKTWNHPAIASGILLVRNSSEASAFEIGR